MRRSLATVVSTLRSNKRVYFNALQRTYSPRLLSPIQHYIPSMPVRYSTTTAVEPVTAHCPGCGASFQKEDPKKPGYLHERQTKEKKLKQQQNTMTQSGYKEALSHLDSDTLAMLGETGVAAEEEEKTWKEHKIPERVVCQRCYSLQHHNAPTTESTPQFLRASQQYSSLEFLKTKQSPLIVAILDVTDLPGSLGQLPKLLSSNPSARILLVANKVDILPETTHKHTQRLRDWIRNYTQSMGIPVEQVLSITLVSAVKGWGISGLMKKIDEARRPTDDVYLVGCTNVGKSALINQFMAQIRGSLDREGRLLKNELKAKYKITSSPAPGTTIGAIKIPLRILGMSNEEEGHHLQRERYMIDTPGLINDQQLIHCLPYQDQKKMVNQREMKPITFRLEPGKSLLLKPLIRMDLLESSDPVLITLFTPLAPHLTRTTKLPSSDPMSTSDGPMIKDQSILTTLKPMDSLIHVNGTHPSQASADLSFAGVGWVAFTGEFDQAKFRVWLPSAVNASEVVHIREPAFLPFEYRGTIRKFFGAGERTRQ